MERAKHAAMNNDHTDRSGLLMVIKNEVSHQHLQLILSTMSQHHGVYVTNEVALYIDDKKTLAKAE